MSYKQQYIIVGPLGNNALSYELRKALKGEDPYLAIPSLIEGALDDVKIGESIVFEEMEGGVLRSCNGLKNFVRLHLSDYPTLGPITIFDNHNHALYFWLESIRVGKVGNGFELIHIDEHSDLWKNENILDVKKGIENADYAWEFTNLSCNVGNYIIPALESGLISKMIRIENEHEIDAYMDYTPSENSILNLDLDIFAPEMDFIPEEKKLRIIRNLLPKVKYATIATSPYFIDQCLALQYLQMILKSKNI